MMAGAVKNTGIIQARVGTVHLASGDKTAITVDRRGLIRVEVTAKTTSRICDFNGVSVKDAVANAGTIESTNVVMSAKTASDVFKNAVNNTGIIRLAGSAVVEEKGIIKIVSDSRVQVSGNLTGNTEASSDTDVYVEGDLTVNSGDLKLMADADLDGSGSFYQSGGTTIKTVTYGNITIQASGGAMLGDIISAGDLMFRSGGAPAVYNQLPGSKVTAAGSVTINQSTTINASNSTYEVGKSWTNLGVFNYQNSTVKLVSDAPAVIKGDITFNNLTIIAPGKSVKFTSGDTIIVAGVLTLSGSYATS